LYCELIAGGKLYDWDLKMLTGVLEKKRKGTHLMGMLNYEFSREKQ